MPPEKSVERRLFHRTDLIWIVGLLGLTLLLYFWLRPSEDGRYAAIYHENQLLATYSLAEDQQITLSDAPTVTFEIRDGAIRFLSSDCPDQTCVRTGFISYGSQYAVCLPNGLSLRIVGDEAVDAITH